MPRRKRAQVVGTHPADVFLNIPYDYKFERLFLAYIAGISAFGLIPRATLEISTSARRLDRILGLLRKCSFAIHDLSRVELDRTPPFSTPRFNMPFELGLSVCLATHPVRHAWFVFESRDHRLAKSLSDLNGTDVRVHHGTIDGVFRELANAFVRQRRSPTIQQMRLIYRDLRQNLARTLNSSGAESPFEARAFKDLCVLASGSAETYVV